MLSDPCLVTGASTGIGRATARALLARGVPVLGGVRRKRDADALTREGIEPLLLDVTDPAALSELAERFAGGRLAGLVNNAGIMVTGPLEVLPLNDLRSQLEIGLVGQLAVTQAVLPALRAARGRIVNVGSIGGRIDAPYGGAYTVTKAALHSMTRVLRQELKPWGVDVTLIVPGSITTPIWGKADAPDGADRLAGLRPGAQALYGPQMTALREIMDWTAGHGIPAERAGGLIADCLTGRRRRTVYTLGPDARLESLLHALLPAQWFDGLVRRAMRMPRTAPPG
ncbi:MAG: Retinol dehydrogenase [Conexibacter sp.]|nr:Retinol dehydrogenase [Conexibacter sp.]